MMAIILSIAYLIVARFLPWSLAISLGAIATKCMPYKQAFVLLMAVGVVEDVVAVRPLGTTSFILLLLAMVNWYLDTHYGRYTWWWSIITSVLGQLVYWKLSGQPASMYLLGIQALTIVIFTSIYTKLFDRDGIYVGI